MPKPTRPLPRLKSQLPDTSKLAGAVEWAQHVREGALEQADGRLVPGVIALDTILAAAQIVKELAQATDYAEVKKLSERATDLVGESRVG